MSRTTIDSKTKRRIKDFPDCSCEPQILGRLLEMLGEPGKEFLYKDPYEKERDPNSGYKRLPILAYTLTGEQCERLAKLLETTTTELLENHSKRCIASLWYDPESPAEPFHNWIRKEIPKILRRLKHGYTCLT